MKKEQPQQQKSTNLLFLGKLLTTALETGVTAYKILGQKRLDVLCNVTGGKNLWSQRHRDWNFY